jgi:hypothetical protein
MTSGLSQDSSNLKHVLNSEVEKYEIHWRINDVVVLVELLIG